MQCATLLSPFALGSVKTGAAQAMLKGGFALQLAAQLSCRAHADAGDA